MNLVRPEQMPYVNAVGARYDSGTYESNMDLALRIADSDGFAARKRLAEARGKLLGLGVAHYVESSIGSPRERAEITILPEGRVRLVIGTQPAGQGQETSFAQVLSDLLSVPVDSIDVVMGDTDVVSVGGGSHSGRSMRHAATVIGMASRTLIERGKAIAALVLDAGPTDIAFADGRFATPGSNRSFDFLELAREGARLQFLRIWRAAWPSQRKTKCTIRSSPMDARYARSRSIPRHAGFRSSVTPRSTMSAAVSTR